MFNSVPFGHYVFNSALLHQFFINVIAIIRSSCLGSFALKLNCDYALLGDPNASLVHLGSEKG